MMILFSFIAFAIYIGTIVAIILLYKEVYTYFRNKNKEYKRQQENNNQ